MELFIFVLLILSFIVGLLGKNTFLGFWGSFILSIFFTPAIILIVILIIEKGNSKKKASLN